MKSHKRKLSNTSPVTKGLSDRPKAMRSRAIKKPTVDMETENITQMLFPQPKPTVTTPLDDPSMPNPISKVSEAVGAGNDQPQHVL